MVLLYLQSSKLEVLSRAIYSDTSTVSWFTDLSFSRKG